MLSRSKSDVGKGKVRTEAESFDEDAGSEEGDQNGDEDGEENNQNEDEDDEEDVDNEGREHGAVGDASAASRWR